jgi:thiol:disulfide interchange protein
MLFLMTIGTFISQAQEIKWMTFNEAIEAQKKDPKPIFMDVYTDWCGPCKMLDKNTFHDANFVAYISKNYYAVKFNGEGTDVIYYKEQVMTNPGHNPNLKGRNTAHQFTSYLKVQGYPSMYIFDAKGEIKSPIVGYYTAEQLLPLIK